MCGRYTITVSLEELMLHFLLGSGPASYGPRYNVAPGQWIPAILGGGEGAPGRLGELRWGLVPGWTKEAGGGPKPINLRAETVGEKPGFQRLLMRKRCLIPADGFYEWRKTGNGAKQPVRFVMKDRSPFGMAALYDTWVDPSGGKLHTCTIITTSPNEVVAGVHDRMPVILPREAEKIWLDRTVADVRPLLPLLTPYPADKMTSYEVDARVGNSRYDAPDCIEPMRTLL
ncbi:SOS response-associated peptidase [Paenibacillus doosanensis]|uniref:Abasic site processing protein n=1 Tax=Paenibacillus konkukensis TaxID=2020716 RepID=A0ABY4RHT1_9BACL|nr:MULTISPECIES: SOS response-associated peptidase [Paenibacillus]MCS7464638.1 SOS response-associated peptidase [Paenibacillus doosanensis]UQZ81976.1 Putative SOS response-associated peptidase YedK [Paenibacillus konkukensis]